MSIESESSESGSTPEGRFSVNRVAELAKLAPQDSSQIEIQLERILSFIAILDELQLDKVEPFFGAFDVRGDDSNTQPQPIREDEPLASLDRNAALENSPVADHEFYIVPPVFD